MLFSSSSSATSFWSAEPTRGRRTAATAIARACTRRGARGGLANRLEAKTRAGRQGRIANHLCRLDFVVPDELGYLPFAQSGGQLLLL